MSQLLRTREELDSALLPFREKKQEIGFVPTMGALHEGHASLVRQAAGCPARVVSVFVNPTQFGPNEDLARYPRTLEADIELAAKAGADFIFAPSVELMYPPGWKTFIEVEGISSQLCGAFRPGHFRGVATVVYRLFDLVKPARAFFGKKDFQQCVVIQKMVEDLGLNVKVELCTTVRENDGLALSSRNRYLQPLERAQAPVIHRALRAALDKFQGGEKSVEKLLGVAKAELEGAPDFRLQYAEIRGLPLLQEIETVSGHSVLAIAGHFGSTRLIDNIELGAR